MNNTDKASCDIKTGMCEIPNSGNMTSEALNKKDNSIRIIYFTDPICSACWGLEPMLRRLKMEYNVAIEYRMGGLLPSWNGFADGSNGISKPSDVAHHWEEFSQHFEMPIDGDIWLEDPLTSSYPPCIAFKAAQMQDSVAAITYLRKLREMVFMKKKNISKMEHLLDAAKESGLDTDRLQIDYKGDAAKLFEEDLKLTQQYGVRGFPTVCFISKDGSSLPITGVRAYSVYEAAVLKIDPSAIKNKIDTSWEHVFKAFTSLTTKEYTTLTGSSKASAETLLQQLHDEGKIKKYTSKNGPLWYN